MFCTHCGTKIEDGAKFCDNCGSPVQITAQPQNPQMQVPPPVQQSTA